MQPEQVLEPAASAPPTQASSSGAGRWRASARRASSSAAPYYAIIAMLVLLAGVLTATQENFATTQNFLNILETNSVLLVIGVGLTFVLVVGGIDLSIGGLLSLSGIVLGQLVVQGVPTLAAAVLIVVGCGLVGFVFNGLLIAKVGLSFFVVTIATASVFSGIALLRTNGSTVGLYDDELLTTLGRGEVLGIPYIVVIAAVVTVLGITVLRYTGYGRMVYAVGGNDEAARLAGISTALVRATAYGLCSALVGLGAVMQASRLSAASPNAGTGLELTVTAAVLLGGTSLMGGQGAILGTLLGTLFLGLLSNGLTLADYSPFWTGIITGAVLVVAVSLDRLRLWAQRG